MVARGVRSPRPPHRWPIAPKHVICSAGGLSQRAEAIFKARFTGTKRLVSVSVTTEFDLDVLRNEIDDIDTKILELVARRVAAVVQIGDYKRSRGIPVYDAARERAVLHRLMGQAPAGLDPQVVRRVFERIIDESRCIEQRQVSVRPPAEE